MSKEAEVKNKRELLLVFIKEVKKEFPDQNWDYLDIISERVLSNLSSPQEVTNSFPDTEADGIVFCGKCGKAE